MEEAEEDNPYHTNSPCPGNIHHEANNPKLAKYIKKIQSDIMQTDDKLVTMKQSAGKLFTVIKKTKQHYVSTLLRGEDDGHCRGIKQRMDP